MTDRRTRRLTAENATTSAGEPIWVDIVEDLTWGELKRLPALSGAKYDDAAKGIAKYVVAWNVEGRNVETGELETVPPPADAGAEAFDAVEPWVISWVFVTLHGVHLGGDALRKKPKTSSDTPDGAPDTSSDSTPANG